MSQEKINYYAHEDKIYVATDCIVFGFDAGVLKLLIFKRRIQPHKGEWSLIGSFVRLNEDVDVAAQRVLEEITGLQNVYFEQLKTYGTVNRDPGFRCVSIGQYALIRIDESDKELVEKHNAFWYELKELPLLCLDHNTMVKDALAKLKRKAQYEPIGFNLLPKKFTMPQLQNLYEAIYQRKFDSRNFRKKVISLKVLKKLEEKDKTTSKKGAFLYQFDQSQYQKLKKSGLNFEI